MFSGNWRNGYSGMKRAVHLPLAFLLLLIQPLYAQDSAPGAGEYSANLPTSDSETGSLGQMVDRFQGGCVRSPSNTFAVFLTEQALKDVKDMEADAFEGMDKERLWSFFFKGALWTIRSVDGSRVNVMFLHPWSDAAVVTTWEYGEEKAQITQLAFVPAEFLRSKGALPVDVRPLWHRMSADMTPVLAVQWAAIRTIEEFESSPADSFIPDARGGGTMDSREIGRTLSAVAAAQLGKSLEARIRFLRAPELAGLRDETGRCAEDLHRGLADCESPWCRSLDQETRKNFQPIKGHMDDFAPMGFLTDGAHSCVFIVCESRPSLGVALLFSKSDQEVRFDKIGYVDFNTLYSMRNEVRSQLPPSFAKEVQP